MWTTASDNILETIRMIEEENLDIRTITMGINLLDCADSDIDISCKKVYEKSLQKQKSSQSCKRN